MIEDETLSSCNSLIMHLNKYSYTVSVPIYLLEEYIREMANQTRKQSAKVTSWGGVVKQAAEM